MENSKSSLIHAGVITLFFIVFTFSILTFLMTLALTELIVFPMIANIILIALVCFVKACKKYRRVALYMIVVQVLIFGGWLIYRRIYYSPKKYQADPKKPALFVKDEYCSGGNYLEGGTIATFYEDGSVHVFYQVYIGYGNFPSVISNDDCRYDSLTTRWYMYTVPLDTKEPVCVLNMREQTIGPLDSVSGIKYSNEKWEAINTTVTQQNVLTPSDSLVYIYCEEDYKYLFWEWYDVRNITIQEIKSELERKKEANPTQ